jgi:hypothetical protein
VRASHCKNVRGAINQRRRQRLTAQVADVCAFFRADLYRVQAWRLSAYGVDAGRKNFDVFTVANHTTKKPFRDGAATNITCADKEDAFHGSHGASERPSNLEANWCKSIQLRHLGAPRPLGATNMRRRIGGLSLRRKNRAESD